ncbi:MAG: hypothetical protein FWF07_04035, partial [Methanomassiliicoccaceae archaeon]|nr:hypothetical protein [Methanomassiliicoccaceae archaeon]
MTKLWGGFKKNGRGPHKKRSVLLYGMIVLVMITTSFAVVQADQGGQGDSSAAGGTWLGDGSQENPYQISDASGLKLLADEVNNDHNTFENVYFILTDDIYLNVPPYNEGSGWTPIGGVDTHFLGNFDGCGHSIVGLTIYDPDNTYMALFGINEGTIKNLGIENASITGDYEIGGITAANGGTIENCYVTGDLTAQFSVGGISAWNSGTIKNCYFNGSLSGNSYVGGIVGNSDAFIEDCYSVGTIIEPLVPSFIGGVAGNSSGGSISGCFFLKDGTINSDLNGIGGIFVSDDPAKPMSSDELQTMSTFTAAGWDFSPVGSALQTWYMFDINIYPGHPTYPMLSWQFADSGTSDSGEPYIIKTIQQLSNIQIFVDNSLGKGMFWQLGTDLDLTDYLAPYGLGYNGGNGWTPIGNGFDFFYGNFDGNGHNITGLTFYRTSNNGYMGFFGYIEGGTIKNLGLVDVSMYGGSYVGGVAGVCNVSTTIENCFVTGSVEGSNNVGGLVGSNYGFVENCYNMCYVKGDTDTGGSMIGGLVGTTIGTVVNCYNAGTVEGSDYIGGVVGFEVSYTIGVCMVSNCYNAGEVIGNSSTGGVVGSFYSGQVENCFFLKEEGGINKDINGFGGSDPDDRAAAIGDDAMRTKSTFTGANWDFDNVWGIYPNDTAGGLCYGYPYIRTIDNYILITPDGGSMIYNGNPAPAPTWTADNPCDKSLFTGSLSYDPAPAIDAKTYNITIGDLDSPYYQVRFKDDVQFVIKEAPVPPSVSYMITASSDANSKITPAGQVSVQGGSSITFTYYAENGYHISSEIIDGKDLAPDQITGTYTFTNIMSNHTIVVKSAPGQGPSGTGTFTLTVDIVGGDGTAEYRIGSGQYVSFTGTQMIPVGSNLYVSVVPDSGYSFVEWT